ncbi:MAG: hypothetical protein AVDCRST_MAG90-2322 [uncultured Microvirga sp.]|uniref:Uncharacterized protein n=1 Tax=uncultured Microvirga sp. TaxID=412392 RepID=A0A6J4M3D3_9HYPH|nr:MAG: hypothetical protein AVDCRST_MAG90-2322 [uncultured Microvirga sp.]
MPPTAPKHALPLAPEIIEPDAHGQAALLLVESLLHALVEKTTLTPAEVIEVLTVAAEVKVEVAEAAGESKGRMQESLNLLARIADSFEADRL